MDRVTFAGVPFRSASPAEAVDFLLKTKMRDGKGTGIHFLNAYSIALTASDAEYRKCVVESAYNFPDGKPISILSGLVNGQKLSQVRGPAFFEDAMDAGRSLGIRHFLLGSSTSTLDGLQRNLHRRYPGVDIVGAFSPPYRVMLPSERDAQDEEMRRSGADVIWVGLGTPKQDLEVARLAAAGFNAVAVGAAFDFSAGTKKEAPKWLSKWGLEWLFRLCAEPRRLWKRYLIGNYVFLRLVIERELIR